MFLSTICLLHIIVTNLPGSIRQTYMYKWNVLNDIYHLFLSSPMSINTHTHTYKQLDVSHHIVITTHLLSIERADWPMLHDMFKARDSKTWQRKFPVVFPARVCDLNLVFISIVHDAVAHIENRCVVKAKRVLLVYWFVRFCAGNFFPHKIERINRPRHVLLHSHTKKDPLSSVTLKYIPVYVVSYWPSIA